MLRRLPLQIDWLSLTPNPYHLPSLRISFYASGENSLVMVSQVDGQQNPPDKTYLNKDGRGSL